MRYYFNNWYKPTKPKEVKGGIKSTADKRHIAKNWWSKKWLEVLESFHLGARLSRGRSYARKGQVMSLSVNKGEIVAEVQGSSQTPYEVTIGFNRFSEKQWGNIIDHLKEKPIYCAQLVNGSMPDDIEELFFSLDTHLFPQRHADLDSQCSCPDWSNPCKHIAAVFFLMAEAFDKNPFLLLELRGMSQEEIMEKLADAGIEQEEEIVELAAEALPTDMGKFWGKEQEKMELAAQDVNLHAAIPKRLGKISFWRSNVDFLKLMEKMYSSASHHALKHRERTAEINNK